MCALEDLVAARCSYFEGIDAVRSLCTRCRFAIPAQRQGTSVLRSQVQLVYQLPGSAADLDVHIVYRLLQIDAEDGLAFFQSHFSTGHEHATTNHAGCAQGLSGFVVAHQGLHGFIELINTGDGRELRQLAGDLGIVEGVQRILVLHLCHQQLHETVLGFGRALLDFTVLRRGPDASATRLTR